MVKQCKAVNPTVNQTPPDGEYQGVWAGYVLKFQVGDDEYRAETLEAILTIAADVVVKVVGGEIFVTLIK